MNGFLHKPVPGRAAGPPRRENLSFSPFLVLMKLAVGSLYVTNSLAWMTTFLSDNISGIKNAKYTGY